MKVKVEPFEFEASNLNDMEITGKTLFSLVSAGTELASLTGVAYVFHDVPPTYPRGVGYASVDRVIAVGDKVKQFKPGDLVLNTGSRAHSSHHRYDVSKRPVVKAPSNASIEEVPFARICGVSMATLRTTRTRPGDIVAVFGLGLVGNLAAQVFQASGYEVLGIDIDAGRRSLAERCGIRHVIDPAKSIRKEVKSAIGEESCHLVLECSGSAKAMLDATEIAKIGADIVQIATPWKEYPDVSASLLLGPLFLKYLHLRGGWEWEIPSFPTDFAKGSHLQNYKRALNLIARKEIKVKELITHVLEPDLAQEAYEGLLNRKDEYIGVLFNWQ
jgi:threonine dehydrogenase-like Zn-dependent dehydrogenase